MKPVPDTVTDPGAQMLYRATQELRATIKLVAVDGDSLRKTAIAMPNDVAGVDRGEVIANATLAYRHLEDASLRLGKALQALDGGVSVYDRATTVGA
jgi:hypothetical protein